MEQDAIKKKGHGLQLAYVALLTLCAPLNLIYFSLSGSILSANMPERNAPREVFNNLTTGVSAIYVILCMIYVMALIVLAILNIIQSFRAYHNKQTLFCINGMLILKYGMVIFFIFNFLSLAAVFLGIGLFALLISHGSLILATPVLLPFILVPVLILAFLTWLMMLPGSFFAVQVIRFSRLEKKISSTAAFFHGLLQFCFIADVLDSMYLAAKKWNRGKKSSIFIGLIYALGIAAVIWVSIKVTGALA